MRFQRPAIREARVHARAPLRLLRARSDRGTDAPLPQSDANNNNNRPSPRGREPGGARRLARFVQPRARRRRARPGARRDDRERARRGRRPLRRLPPVVRRHQREFLRVSLGARAMERPPLPSGVDGASPRATAPALRAEGHVVADRAARVRRLLQDAIEPCPTSARAEITTPNDSTDAAARPSVGARTLSRRAPALDG